MQAVILAAGKGTRMGELTIDTPKPLLSYKGKNLLEWKIESLPDPVDEVIIIIGYLGNKIKENIGDTHNGKKITYVWHDKIDGTGAALWEAKDLLRDSFMVMMGDDIYDKDSVLEASKKKWSVVGKEVDREDNESRLDIDENGKLTGFLSADKYREKYNGAGLAFTGLYTLHTNIFNYPLVKMKTKEEWGLPHTLSQLLANIDVEIIKTNFWKQISTPEDLI